MNATTIQLTETTVPFSSLILSPKNARKNGRDSADYKAGIESLAASIKSKGLLQNLIVHDTGAGTYAVDGGGRRLDALTLLVDRAIIPADYSTRVVVIPEGDSTAASLAENIQRENMHPADEFDAFLELTKEGHTIDRIADAFGVTPLVVERRLKLTAASPALIQEFREGGLSTDQMIALCANDDHAVQESVWNRCRHGYYNKPAELRRAVLAEEVQADRDPRVAFIGGIATYEAAGGEVRRDLFSGDGKGAILTNPALVDQLVADKLEAEAEKVRAEGWAWVDVWASWDHTAEYRLGTTKPTSAELSDEAQAQIAELEAEAEALQDEKRQMHAVCEEEDDRDMSDAEYDRDEAIDERLEVIGNSIAQIKTANAFYPDEVKAASGVIVAYTPEGLKISRGRVRAADRAQLAEAVGKGAIVGGRETDSAGRKDNAMSDALRRSLLARRNQAAQIALSENPRVAKILLTMQLVDNVGGHRWHFGSGERLPCDLTIGQGDGEGARTHHPMTGDDAKDLHDQLSANMQALLKGLPEDRAKQWDWFAAKTDAELDALAAFGVANALSLHAPHDGFTGKILDALDFDVSTRVTMTADNYFDRVPKTLMVEAMDEAGKVTSEEDRAALLALKKGELSATAESRIAGTNWVPALIRTPARAVPKAPKQAKASTKDATTPAKAKAGKTAAAKKPAGNTNKAKAKPTKG